MQTIKIKTEGRYHNHGVKQNKAIDIQFKLPYSELTNYIQSIQMLNENITLGGKIGSDKKINTLGTFMIHSVKVDNDGEGTIKFSSQLDFADMEVINELAIRNDEPFTLFMKADIDVSDLEDNEDETEVETEEEESGAIEETEENAFDLED